MAYQARKNQIGGQEIVIGSWEKGIATTPYGGINDIRAVNVSDIPGSVFASAKTTNNLLFSDIPYLGVNYTFTADASTDQITLGAGGTAVNWEYTVVQFTTTGTLPAGLSLSTNYYLRYISAGVYKVATTLANAINAVYVNITDTGSGTHTATSTNIGIINATAKDERSGNIYAIDVNNRVWCSNVPGESYYKWMLITGNTITNGYGNGIAVWQNYLFVFRSQAIDVWGALDNFSTATWNNGWQSMNSGSTSTMLHKTFLASNNALYWCDYVGNTGGLRNPGYIGSLMLASTSTFVPGTGSTYVYNAQALDLPDNEQPVALNELNGYLTIGVNMSGTNTSGSTSKLYYWDTVSASFNNPLIVPEAPIYEIVNANNIIYVFCGWRGRVYKTNLSTITEAFKIPDHMYYPGNTTTGYEGLPLFGNVSQSIYGSSSKITFAPQARVTRKKIMFCVNLYGSTALWSYDTQSGLLQIDAKPINGYGSTSTDSPQLYGVEVLNSQISASTLGTEILFFGLYYNTGTITYTIEQYNPITQNSSSNFTTYNGSVITDYMNVGSANNLKTFQQLEYSLDRKMITGSGLKIYYRYSIGDSWTLLSTEDYATYGAINGRCIDFPTVGTEWIQLKVELNAYTVLRDIILR